ncbi:MAG TPA: DUF2062 domain-containing protein [Vicinamibacterales bacterium]|jgi:uncharacterized protein (DUF2062 family)
MIGASRYRRWLEQLLHTHDTPQRTAGAFALGVFLGFSPFLGLHAVMGLTLAFLLGLNRVAVILGVYSNLPWILPAYYTLATLAGAKLLGIDIQPQALEQATAAFRSAGWADMGDVARLLAPFMWAYLVGSTLGAAVLAGVSYRVSLTMIVAHRRSQAASSPSDL